MFEAKLSPPHLRFYVLLNRIDKVPQDFYEGQILWNKVQNSKSPGSVSELFLPFHLA